MSAYPPVAELLPHRGRAILIDEVEASHGEITRCKVVVRADMRFAADGRLPGLIVVELMAQCVGAHAGLRGTAAERHAPGLLLACRETWLARTSFSVGEELTIEARHLWGETRLGVFLCRVLCGTTVVAAARLTVSQGMEGLFPT